MRPNINQVIKDPERLGFDNCWSFYDWFCNESSLERRAKSFIPKLKFIVDEGLIDGNKTYVWFKNNCPMCGTLYDDMRISTIENDDFVGGITPRSGHDIELKSCIWVLLPEYKSHEFKDWSTLKSTIKKDDHFKEMIKKSWRS